MKKNMYEEEPKNIELTAEEIELLEVILDGGLKDMLLRRLSNTDKKVYQKVKVILDKVRAARKDG